MSGLILREMRESDLPALFEIRCDAVGQRMAAFTDTRNDREAYLAKHRAHLADDRIVNLVVELDGEIIGSAASFPHGGQTEVTYWIRRDHWGRGVAGRALAALLEKQPVRPIFGAAAADNAASRWVLERAGFKLVDTGRGFAEARGAEIDEVVFRLG